MPCHGLWAWGAKLRAVAFLLLALSSLTACGSGEGKKRALECQTDDDCDASELGVCDTVSCEENKCVPGRKPDGKRCDDADPLTREDSCLDGICSGMQKSCDDDLGPCLKAVHDPETDECTVEPVEDGVTCDDKDACTQVDSCQAGECVGAEPKTCAATDDCHVDGKCDSETGECSVVQAEDGAPCDDAQACTSNDACTDGVCGGEAVVCDDGLACSKDSCDKKSGACAADMSQCSCLQDADCQDGNACNGAEVCDPTEKLCKLGTAVACPSSLNPCLQNVCVAETGACEPEPVKDGAACDDSNACTTKDTCQAGTCQGSAPVVCAALSQCHKAGTCNKVTGACDNPELPANTSCNDGNACTVKDTCKLGECVGSAPVSCAAVDQCHDAGVCNTATGICSKPTKLDGVKCDDGSPCTNGDACKAGVCTPASQVVCTALDSCHAVGTCDQKTGVCSNPAQPDGTSCSDGLTCTLTDTCKAGKCGGTAQVCNDGIACSVDSCSEKLGGCTADKSKCPCETSAQCDDGNPCNGVESCNLQTLQCVQGKAVDCAALNDACNVGACSATTGKCIAVPKANGTTCDDANACTQSSSCQAGACQGQNPVTCAASDQCHDAGSCNPATGVCSNPVKANGAACNDGNACTKTDSCQSGQCTGSSAVVCSASDQCHGTGTCDTSTGVCSNPALKNGTACSDGTLCTQTDTCQGGTCVGGSTVTCSASDQCHDAGTCDGSTGKCSNPVKADGSSCDDGTLCTQTDTCKSGACQGAKPVTCSASDQCHDAGTCDGSTGKCSNPAKKDGTACNDASACTKTDTCQSGACKGASPVTCSASDQCHDAGTCDPSTGTCSNPNKTDGTPCSDGKSCTGSDKCTAGVCGGAGITCDDKIACTVDSCVEPGGCNFDKSKCACTKDADCDDKDACTGTETCNLQTLTCVPGTKVSCSNLDDVCNVGVCNALTGACSATPRKDGTACDDGNACTRTDGCVAGKCQGSNSVSCSASDQCHDVGVCDTKTGVCSNPNKTNGTTCNDGNKCTLTDTCQSGACNGTAVKCSASDQCHSAGTCDTSTGACTNPIKTGSCDDGDACTQTDTCQSGTCVGGNPVGCSAQDQCHDVGTCVKATGLCTNPAKGDGTACDDGNKCTLSDTCQTGKCTSGKASTCGVLGQCFTAGTCDPQSGLCSNPAAPSGTKCNDTNACTSGEVCDGKGNCGGGNTVICPPPTSQCQTSACNTTLGCQVSNVANGTPCDDGSVCTQTDQCSNGSCSGGDKLLNALGDWADDPGAGTDEKPRTFGPTSTDIFTDKAGRSHLVGIYTGNIRFNDKDTPASSTQLLLPATQTTGIYWGVYSEAGAVARVGNLGGLDAKGGTLTVSDAASLPDGSFTLLGTVQGNVGFGLNGKTKNFTLRTPSVYLAHYLANGTISWVTYFVPGGQVAFTADSVSMAEDGSVIAIGTVGGTMTYYDAGNPPATGAAFAGTETAGVWAVRLDPSGLYDPKSQQQWAEIVVRGGGLLATAVVAHDQKDNGASLTGAFSGRALLGIQGEIIVDTGTTDKLRDIWYLKLDVLGRLLFGGRVGGSGADLARDVSFIPGGGTLLLANTTGSDPTAGDAKNTQQLHAATSGAQAHILSINRDGVIESDALISNKENGVTIPMRLERDLNGFYAVAGLFGTQTTFWSQVGFGSGLPQTPADFTIKTLKGGPNTLFLARVDEKSTFHWGVQLGGDNATVGDVVLAAMPSHSATVAGTFNGNVNAASNDFIFGDQVTEALQAASPGSTSNGYVVHLNSQAEYDYCQ